MSEVVALWGMVPSLPIPGSVARIGGLVRICRYSVPNVDTARSFIFGKALQLQLLQDDRTTFDFYFPLDLPDQGDPAGVLALGDGTTLTDWDVGTFCTVEWSSTAEQNERWRNQGTIFYDGPPDYSHTYERLYSIQA
jgi:hypothetical protein